LGVRFPASEDIGACRRFPLALAHAAHNTRATARASIVFPSDEKDRAAMVLQRSGPSFFRPASGDVSARGDVNSNKSATKWADVMTRVFKAPSIASGERGAWHAEASASSAGACQCAFALTSVPMSKNATPRPPRGAGLGVGGRKHARCLSGAIPDARSAIWNPEPTTARVL
jgi:hypothetical protein